MSAPPSSAPTSTEGYISFHGHKTWYRAVGGGDPSKLPLLTLHGGPGAGHDYLEPFESLAADGRQVIFYDQLGCARSAIEEPHDPAVWTIELFVAEVDAVRAALGLDRLHILGQSWGGMLLMEYMLTKPGGVASIVIESSPCDMRQWVAEANRLREALPPDVQATLLRHEAAGTTDSPDYTTAVNEFYRRHVIRIEPIPGPVARTMANIERNPEVYFTMNGPSEFHVIGTLKDWDVSSRLGEIEAPALVLSGAHDEATPTIARRVHEGIRGSEWVLFEESAHNCHIEEHDRCMAVMGDFLAAHD